MSTWKPTLALGAVLAFGAAASAAERDALPTTGGPSTTMTLGGKGTPAQAATEDTELARGYHGHYGGHYGGYGYGHGHYGGYGHYRGGYYGGYYGGYQRGYYGGYGFYRPAYYGGYYGGYYRPAYYAPRAYYSSYYSYPVYSSYYGYGGGFGFSIGIGGNAITLNAPAVNLGASLALPALDQMPSQPMAPPVAPGGDGTFRYDGGPASPVPLPKADPQPMVPPGNASSLDLPVSLKSKTTVSPYKYKAYGEK